MSYADLAPQQTNKLTTSADAHIDAEKYTTFSRLLSSTSDAIGIDRVAANCFSFLESAVWQFSGDTARERFPSTRWKPRYYRMRESLYA
jgi:hypothetical protein